MAETDAVGTRASVVESLLGSYAALGGVNFESAKTLPSRQGICSILMALEELLFPGFQREASIHEANLRAITASGIDALYLLLHEQFRRDLAFSRQATVLDADVVKEAEAHALAVLASLPSLRMALDLDVMALLQGDPAARAKEEIILAYPGLRAILVHRFAHGLWQRNLRLVARMASEEVHSRTGIDIHPGATIGASFYIDHGTGIVIGETSHIGANVKIYQGVSLGALSVKKQMHAQKRHPTIEDHVTLYAGATILGGETLVGHHSIVGGNVWLTQSVPPYSRVEHEAVVKVAQKAKSPT